MSARAVAEVAAALSSRDQAILRSVGELRFMTTKQIERLHFTDHATPLAAARICRRVLNRLQETRLLNHLDRRVGGVRAGSAGYIWTLGLVGDHVLRHLAGDGIRQRLKEPSTTFVDHTLAIAEAHVGIVEASRNGLFELISYRPRTGVLAHLQHGDAGQRDASPRSLRRDRERRIRGRLLRRDRPRQ